MPEHAAEVPPFAAAVKVIFADPLKLTPLIVLAVSNLDAVAALPEHAAEVPPFAGKEVKLASV